MLLSHELKLTGRSAWPTDYSSLSSPRQISSYFYHRDCSSAKHIRIRTRDPLLFPSNAHVFNQPVSKPNVVLLQSDPNDRQDSSRPTSSHGTPLPHPLPHDLSSCATSRLNMRPVRAPCSLRFSHSFPPQPKSENPNETAVHISPLTPRLAALLRSPSMPCFTIHR